MKNYLTLLALFIGQGLIGSVISLLTLSSTLVGNQLAPYPQLASIPIMATVLGAAIMVYFASQIMAKQGRRMGFLISSLIGIIGSITAMISISQQSFELFVIAALILGFATVFNQYYRFAAAEIFELPSIKNRCTALIIGGGIIGGILGPWLATQGKALFPQSPFLGTFLLALILFILSLAVHTFINLPHIPNQQFQNDISLPHTLPPKFIIGTLSCALGFALMTLIMNATPLIMHHQHYTIEQSAYVLQWHFIAMYAPALLLTFFIHKIPIYYLIQLGGISFLFGSLSIYLLPQESGFLYSLIAVGIGWSLMFTGGTLLINQLNQKNKYQWQGINSLITYILNLLASLSVGFLVYFTCGWHIIHSISCLIILVFIIYIHYVKIN
ncbi:MFS transporter [Volucribacter psittacicida]|uniref:MFS transporter n=1 Tax=Volucribacter psittacicida TaxID=203482 RepID=A0A4R1FL16_9PAST|nr:MFS transporter [Volucribacter psittacicida]TCJ93949.1 MFS transporter [Volucribacter psittacicida]